MAGLILEDGKVSGPHFLVDKSSQVPFFIPRKMWTTPSGVKNYQDPVRNSVILIVINPVGEKVSMSVKGILIKMLSNDMCYTVLNKLRNTPYLYDGTPRDDSFSLEILFIKN